MLTFARLTLPAKISLTRFIKALLMATKFNLPITPAGIADNIDAFDDLAQDIANPPVDRPLRGGIARAGQKYCDYLGAIPGQASGLLGPGFSTGSLLCDPYWKKNGYSPPEDAPTFSGGQCAGVAYRVTGTITTTRASCSGASPVTSTGSDPGVVTRGPISIRRDTDVPTACTPPRPTKAAWLVDGFTEGGEPETKVVVGRSTSTGAYTSATATFLVERVDLAPDGCGDPPEGLGPGFNPPPAPTFPPGEEPGVDLDGQPFFFVPPVDSPIDGGDPVDVPEDSPGGDSGGPTEPPVAGGDESGEPGDNPFPPPPDGRRWVGCCIRLTTIPQGTGTVPGTAPETILTQVVGNARLLFDSVSGDGYDTPVQVRSAGLCLWEPVKGLSPKGIRVNLKPGFEYAYTPFSVEDTE